MILDGSDLCEARLRGRTHTLRARKLALETTRNSGIIDKTVIHARLFHRRLIRDSDRSRAPGSRAPGRHTAGYGRSGKRSQWGVAPKK